jgi:hypothetical protein
MMRSSFKVTAVLSIQDNHADITTDFVHKESAGKLIKAISSRNNREDAVRSLFT